MTTKYICTDCTGRSGEEHTFKLSQQPKACPFNGCDGRYVKTIESYLRQQLDDAEWKANHQKEQRKEFQEKIRTMKPLAEQMATGEGWDDDQLQLFLNQFDLDNE